MIERGRAAILLTDRVLRDRFYDDLNGLVEAVPMTIFAAVFDKASLRTRYGSSGGVLRRGQGEDDRGAAMRRTSVLRLT